LDQDSRGRCPEGAPKGSQGETCTFTSILSVHLWT